mmetsp:Transcript_14221/g.40399  ORF Transcript_14221/g.40399 Transcript_14221/m.40399 type:complete len:319 (+) Transcript_14221:100-1056(+)|eukprot:CAMPEP_0119145028 /NCGR_PEP_ID=MMETSP1310-20130426/36892_1 /TAXON_ID=464262 /ORGANISM="Genus nov. species nov., Strain RCC2339" /LENGTH=318 /DNA_ID=CAMNT_0007136819 /DNA_START=92 /DNA_END=1048 /DNA_ORIENTATION=+
MSSGEGSSILREKRIDGKGAGKIVTDAVARACEVLKEKHGVVPGLATVIVGDNPASKVYVRMKQRKAESLGLASIQHTLPEETTTEQLLGLVDELNTDSRVHGILVQLPLPAHINERTVLEAVRPEKDADGLHPVNAGRLAAGDPSGMLPCTPMGCVMLMAAVTPGGLSGKHAVVVGRSRLVGRPVSLLLLNENCTVTMAHSRTRNLEGVCREADLLVVAVGQPRLIPGKWLKPGAVVIDVGINRVEPANPGGKAKLVGDVDYDSAIESASAVTPVPGGVGPMTIACLMCNTVRAACLAHNISDVPVPSLRLPEPVGS